jgi:hypothetical protein
VMCGRRMSVAIARVLRLFSAGEIAAALADHDDFQGILQRLAPKLPGNIAAAAVGVHKEDVDGPVGKHADAAGQEGGVGEGNDTKDQKESKATLFVFDNSRPWRHTFRIPFLFFGGMLSDVSVTIGRSEDRESLMVDWACILCRIWEKVIDIPRLRYLGGHLRLVRRDTKRVVMSMWCKDKINEDGDRVTVDHFYGAKTMADAALGPSTPLLLACYQTMSDPDPQDAALDVSLFERCIASNICFPYAGTRPELVSLDRPALVGPDLDRAK